MASESEEQIQQALRAQPTQLIVGEIHPQSAYPELRARGWRGEQDWD